MRQDQISHSTFLRIPSVKHQIFLEVKRIKKGLTDLEKLQKVLIPEIITRELMKSVSSKHVILVYIGNSYFSAIRFFYIFN